MSNKYKQGKYIPTNPEKWLGNINDIVYRSGWELKLMMKFDKHLNIINVASEEFPFKGELIRGIPYFNPIKKKMARYFIDFYIKYLKNGVETEALIEVKPYKQTIPPQQTFSKTGKKTRKRQLLLEKEMLTYIVNTAKWDTARSFCKANNFLFFIITEKDTGLF